MDRSCVITLVGETYTTDGIGQQIVTPIATDVYAQVESVSGTEWHDAGRNGIRPSYRFVMFLYDYNDETTIEYNGKSYSVYRTFIRKDDNIELYVQERGGDNNA